MTRALIADAGAQKALEFFTGYVIEKSLSVDNVFVFAMLFSYFAVPPLYQHQVLFWGILVMDKFHYLKIGLGVMLAFVGVKMLLAHSPYELDTLLSLGVVVGILAMSVVASLLRPTTTGSFEGPGGPASLGA